MKLSISIITPSYNQGEFIERTIKSVCIQKYVSEHIVIDGGSTDDTIKILKKFGNKVKWISESDKGQANAINKGVLLTNSDIIGWLNSDDIYYESTIEKVLNIFEENNDIEVIYGDANHIDIEDKFIEKYYTEEFNYEKLKEVCFICQPATFFRRSVVNKYGLLDEKLNYCMDYEFWLRLAKKGAKFKYVEETFAGSRLHINNKTIGSSKKVHEEINDMMLSKFGLVPYRWISNYAYTFICNKKDSELIQKLKKTILIQLALLKWRVMPYVKEKFTAKSN